MNANEMNLDNQSNNMEKSFVSENLFVEKDEPNKQTSNEQAEVSKLAEFLNRDFRAIGYRDGYRYSNSDVMDNAMRLIRCDYREIIDRMIEEYRGTISRLQIQAIELRQISLKAEEKVNTRISSVQDTITRLNLEKENSSLDEGLIMKVIHMYRDGFIRGVNDNNDELLLMSYNGLFK